MDVEVFQQDVHIQPQTLFVFDFYGAIKNIVCGCSELKLGVSQADLQDGD